MSQSLECPVTLQPFQHPKVLPCGHTIDNHVIQQMHKRQCPICRRPFFTDPPTNWVLVDLLHLKIDTTMPSSGCIPRYRRRQHAVIMHERTRTTIEHLIQSNHTRILDKIAHCANKGMSETTFNMTDIRAYGINWDQKECIFLSIADRLETMGYTIEHKPIIDCVGAHIPRIHIQWTSLMS